MGARPGARARSERQRRISAARRIGSRRRQTRRRRGRRRAGRRRAHIGRAAAVRRSWSRRRQAPHRPVAQRPGATDLRLWTLDAIDELDAAVTALGRALVATAKDGLDAILPGYTHGQRAQPVRWAYVLLAHAWPLVRDRQRLADARRRTSEMPLGSGALAGSGFPVD